MSVSITDNLTEIDAVDAANEAGWTPTSSSDFAGFQRAGNLCYGDQASQGVFNQFFTDSAIADFTNRTIFGWMRSGNPDTEANDGFGIIIGDLIRELSSVGVNTVGAGYSTADVLTVVGGTFKTVATVNVDTVSTIQGQDQTNYDGAGGNGTFAGGTGHAVNDVITLSDGSTITVDAVSAGVVTQFTITTNSTGGFADAATLTQSSTTGIGISFSLSPGLPNQEIETVSVNVAGDYSIDPSTPNTPTGGSGTGAILDLTMADGGTGVRTSYTVGGSENYGHFVLGWSGFRLDLASLPTNFLDIVGTAPPYLNRLIDFGYAIDYQTKALGNADNIFFDRLSYAVNGSPALTVAGGTTGARGTFAEMVTDDLLLSNAYGIIRELVGAKAYELFFGIDFGDSGVASTFFEDSDFQLFLNGDGSGDGGMSAGNMDIAMLANSTGTNVLNFSDFLIQGVGTVANIDVSDANIDELKWERGVITDLGTFAFPPQDAGNKFLDEITFNNCGQVTPDTLDLDEITFNGTTDADGALFLDEATHSNMSSLSFVSDGDGHAIQLIPVGAGPFSFTWDNWVFSGYGADDTTDAVLLVDNALDADITINIINGGDTPTVRKAAGYTGTVTINNTVTLAVQCNDADGDGIEGVSVRIENASTGALISEGTTNASGTFTDSTFNFTGDLAVTVKARLKGFFFDRQGGTITSSGLAASFTLRTNPIVDLP